MSRYYKTTATPTVDYGFELPFDELFRAKEYKDKRHDKSLETLQTSYDEMMQMNYKPDDEGTVNGWKSNIQDIYTKYSQMPDLSNAEGLIKRDIQGAIPSKDIQDVQFNYDRWVAEQQNIMELKKNNQYNPANDPNIGNVGPTLDQFDADGNLTVQGTNREFDYAEGGDRSKAKAFEESFFNNMPDNQRTQQGIANKAAFGSESWQEQYSSLIYHYGEKNIKDDFIKAANGDPAAMKRMQEKSYDMLYNTGMERFGVEFNNGKNNGKNNNGNNTDVTTPSSYYNKVINRASTPDGTDLSSSELITLTGNEGTLVPNSTAVNGTGVAPDDNRLYVSPSFQGNLPYFVSPDASMWTSDNKGEWVNTDEEGSAIDRQIQSHQYQLLKEFYEGANVSFDNMGEEIQSISDLTSVKNRVVAIQPGEYIEPALYLDQNLMELLPAEELAKLKNSKGGLDKSAVQNAKPILLTEDLKQKMLSKLNQNISSSTELMGPYLTGEGLSAQQSKQLIQLQNSGIYDPFGTEARNIYKANEKYLNDLSDEDRIAYENFTKVLEAPGFKGADYEFVPLSGNNTFLEYVPGLNGEEGTNQMLTYGTAYFTEQELDNIINTIPEEDRTFETIEEDDRFWDFDGSNLWIEQLTEKNIIQKTTHSVKSTDPNGKATQVPVYGISMVLRNPVGGQARARYDDGIMKMGTDKSAQYGDQWDQNLNKSLNIISSTNELERGRKGRNTSNRYMIEGYVGNNIPGAEVSGAFNTPDMVNSRQLLFDNVIANENTGIVSQLDRLKDIDPALHGELSNYISDEIEWLTRLNETNGNAGALTAFMNKEYGGKDLIKLRADLNQKAGRVIRMNSLINPQMHNALVKDYTDSELRESSRVIVSDFTRLDNSLDASNSNNNIGIENGRVTDFDLLRTATDRQATIEGYTPINDTEYSNITLKDGNNGVNGAYLNPGAQGSLNSLNTFASANNMNITVTSMFRLPAYNKIVKGHQDSPHLDGNALDLDLSSGRQIKQAFDSQDPTVRGAIRSIQLHGDHYHVILKNSTQSKGE